MRRRHKLALLVFLFSPLAVVTLLCVLIARSLDDGIVKQTPIGAGAGETGGANFIGDQLAHRDASTAAIKPTNGHAATPAPTTPAPAPADGEMVNPVTLDTGFYIIVSDKTGKANPGSPIYLAGTLNGWDPGNERYKLSAQSDMRWRLHVTKEMLKGSPSTVEFKFTRGSWSVEELNADFSVPANKMLPKVSTSSIKPGEPPAIEYTIVAWTDTAPNFTARHIGDDYRPVNATGIIRRVQVQGGVGQNGHARDLLVWLPPGYDAPENAARTYPVLYMMDGQNLFEKHAKVPAEWKADETATSLISSGRATPFIIVGVPNAGEARMVEYMPPGMGASILKGAAPQGDAHLSWLTGTVMPRIEASFRVAKGASNTGIGGSSLGGLIALYAGAKHPDTFGIVLAESPALRLSGGDEWKSVFGSVSRWPSRMFIGVGGKEAFDDQQRSDSYAAAVKDFDAMLTSAGLTQNQKLFAIEKDAVHNEDAWAARLPTALSFLFPPVIDSSK